MKYVVLAALGAGALAIAAPATAQQSPSSMPNSAPSTGSPSGYGGAATGPGASQSTSTLDMAGLKPVDTKSNMNLTYNGLSIDQLKNASIENPNGDKVGSVDKILADKDNKVAAITADAGGFLGIGAKEVVIPMNQLQYDTAKKAFVTSLSKDDVKSMPEWKK